jgi:PAS domain S-box-containing protein
LPVLVWAADGNNRRVHFNRAWKDFAGDSAEPLSEDSWFERVHPDDRLNYVGLYADAFAERKSFRSQYRFRAGDNREHWILESAAPRYSGAGEYAGMIGTGIDITEQKLVEDGLRQGYVLLEKRIADRTAELWHTIDRVKNSEESLRSILNSVHDGIFVHSFAGEILDVNDKVLSMYRIERADAMRYSILKDLSAPDNPLDKLESIWQDVEAGETRFFEWKARRPGDGSTFDVEVFLKSVILVDQAVILATVRDISLRKRMQRELLQTGRMEMARTVVGGIAHDFNNILNNVQGFAHLLKKYSADHGRTVRYSEAIVQSVQRGSKLADHLLLLSSPESAEQRTLHLADLVQSAVEAVRPSIQDSICIQSAVPIDLPAVLGDRNTLIDALKHVLINAGEAILRLPSGAERSIVIEGSVIDRDDESVPLPLRGKRCIDLTVRDTGPGIPAAVFERMFEPFASTKPAGFATGLGLAVAYAVMRGHGGAISAGAPGGPGTVIHLWFPVAGISKPEAEPTGPLKPRRSGETILLVDDELAMREFGRDILEEQGYSVLTASNGMEAVEIFKSKSGTIDLVILDLVMPQMDGGQTFLELKNIRSDVRAFFCTGFTSDQVITSLLREHGLKALRKPFDIKVFLATIRELLDEGRPHE